MATGLSEATVLKKFEGITGAQDSIQSVSLWIIHHKSDKEFLVSTWLKVLKKASTSQKVLLFYLCNDVLQNCKRKRAPVFLESFKPVLLEGLKFVNDDSIKAKVIRILNIWEERNVYKKPFIDQLRSLLDGKSTGMNYRQKADKFTVVSEDEQKETKAQLIVEFKPQDLITKVTIFRKFELENELKQQQLSKMVFDESSIEAVKQLKDKSQGKEFTNSFEDYVKSVETTIKYLEQDINERGEIIDLAESSEIFYDEQYKEARIVANAYRNFGTRINNMKRKLEDIKTQFPVAMSPVASPSLDAPSPEPTPPQCDPNDYTDAVDMEIDSDEERKKRKAKNDPRIENIRKIDVCQTQEYNGKEHNKKNDSKSSTEDHHPKLHQKLRSVVNVVTPVIKEKQISFEENVTSQTQELDIEDNELGSSTPVQDEVIDTITTPKENPIDFLTKLLSKTTPSIPVTGASFLQNLSLITSTVKTQFQQNKLTQRLSDEQNNVDEVERSQHSWASWEAEGNSKVSPMPNIPVISDYSASPSISSIEPSFSDLCEDFSKHTNSSYGVASRRMENSNQIENGSQMCVTPLTKADCNENQSSQDISKKFKIGIMPPPKQYETDTPKLVGRTGLCEANLINQVIMPVSIPSKTSHMPSEQQSIKISKMLPDESGLDDILNQIVSGEGFLKSDNPIKGVKETVIAREGDNLDIDTSSSFLSPTPGKGILRKSKSVFSETSSQPHNNSSKAKSVPIESCERDVVENHPQYIQTLETVERDPTEDIEDFSEKLNTDSNAYDKNTGFSYSCNPVRPNLTCLTPSDFVERKHYANREQHIIPLESIRPIESLVSCSNPETNIGKQYYKQEVEPHQKVNLHNQLKSSHTHDNYGDSNSFHYEPHYNQPIMESHRSSHHNNPHHMGKFNHPRELYERYHRDEMYPVNQHYVQPNHFGPLPPKRPYTPRPYYRY